MPKSKLKKFITKKHATCFMRANTEEEVYLLDMVKKHTGEKTYTGGMWKAGNKYLAQLTEIRLLKDEVEFLRTQLKTAEEILLFHHHAQQMLQRYSVKFVKGKYPQPELF